MTQIFTASWFQTKQLIKKLVCVDNIFDNRVQQLVNREDALRSTDYNYDYAFGRAHLIDALVGVLHESDAEVDGVHAIHLCCNPSYGNIQLRTHAKTNFNRIPTKEQMKAARDAFQQNKTLTIDRRCPCGPA